MSPREYIRGEHRAQELYGDFWFNSEPLPLMALRGGVVLLEFWDHTCCRSLRSIPYLESWKQKYSEAGLTVVGVHSPRFAFGHDPGNVDRAIKHLGISYPVVMDNDHLIWSRYDNRMWPTRYLLDRDGFLRYQFVGDTDYPHTEHAIQMLLCAAGGLTDFPELTEPYMAVDRPGVVTYKATSDLYAGYLRGSVGNVEGSVPEAGTGYTDPKMYFEGRLYLDGAWTSSKESLDSLAGQDRQGSVIMRYTAAEATGVLGSTPGKVKIVEVRQNDSYLSAEQAGEDVVLQPDGRSITRVEEPRMYRLVRNRGFGDHVLRLTGTGPGLSVFAFGFLSGVIPEFVPSAGNE